MTIIVEGSARWRSNAKVTGHRFRVTIIGSQTEDREEANRAYAQVEGVCLGMWSGEEFTPAPHNLHGVPYAPDRSEGHAWIDRAITAMAAGPVHPFPLCSGPLAPTGYVSLPNQTSFTLVLPRLERCGGALHNLLARTRTDVVLTPERPFMESGDNASDRTAIVVDAWRRLLETGKGADTRQYALAEMTVSHVTRKLPVGLIRGTASDRPAALERYLETYRKALAGFVHEASYTATFDRIA